jgi:MFS family permease
MAESPADSAAVRPGGWWRELTGYHWWVLLVATLGWLFDTLDQRLFILARTPALRQLLPALSDVEVGTYAGTATAVFILGWATGGIVFGLFGDRWGRTRTMMLTILLYSLFTGLSALARSWWDFALYRFLSGLGIGGEYAAGVALVAEVMPARARPYCLGFLQGFAALGNVAGSALSLVVGPQAEVAGVAGWRLLFLVGVVPALLVVLVRLRLREPDRWLQARQQATPDEYHRQMGDLREIIHDPRWRRHALVGLALALAGQCGLWGIGFWSPELIRAALLDTRRQQAGITDRPSAEELARRVSADEAETQEQVGRWKAEEDRLVGQGTVLQDLAGMCGIYAFTWLTARTGRRRAFGVGFLLALGATVLVFGRLSKPVDVYWMAPLLGFCASSVYGGYAIYFPELFPTRLRSTGTGVCYNGARYVTALGPVTLGQLQRLYASLGSGLPLRPAAMTLALVYLIGCAAVRFAPETKGRPLPE